MPVSDAQAGKGRGNGPGQDALCLPDGLYRAAGRTRQMPQVRYEPGKEEITNQGDSSSGQKPQGGISPWPIRLFTCCENSEGKVKPQINTDGHRLSAHICVYLWFIFLLL